MILRMDFSRFAPLSMCKSHSQNFTTKYFASLSHTLPTPTEGKVKAINSIKIPIVYVSMISLLSSTFLKAVTNDKERFLKFLQL